MIDQYRLIDKYWLIIDQWSESHNLYLQLFRDDIEYLLKMQDLWKQRRKPQPIAWNNFGQGNTQQTDDTADVNSVSDQWSIIDLISIIEQLSYWSAGGRGLGSWPSELEIWVFT